MSPKIGKKKMRNCEKCEIAKKKKTEKKFVGNLLFLLYLRERLYF